MMSITLTSSNINLSKELQKLRCAFKVVKHQKAYKVKSVYRFCLAPYFEIREKQGGEKNVDIL